MLAHALLTALPNKYLQNALLLGCLDGSSLQRIQASGIDYDPAVIPDEGD